MNGWSLVRRYLTFRSVDSSSVRSQTCILPLDDLRMLISTMHIHILLEYQVVALAVSAIERGDVVNLADTIE
jgi:hypothetical protein